MKNIGYNAVLSFTYRNHINAVEERTVCFKGLTYGSNEWHPEPVWLMNAWCYDRNAVRTFDLARIDAESVTLL